MLSAEVGFAIHHHCITSEDAAVQKVTHSSLSEFGLLFMKALKYDTRKPQKQFVTLQEICVTAHLP